MSGIKYYQLKKDEELPDEFCAVKDVNGEPSEYTFYRPETENAKLREQMERLVTLLRVDCDIEASWDGLRKFWSIELTEGGCLMRDKACKIEAENAKLREEAEQWHRLTAGIELPDYPITEFKPKDLERENAKLRKLCADMYRCSDPCNDCPHYNGSNDGFYCDLGIGWKARRMHELGIEVTS